MTSFFAPREVVKLIGVSYRQIQYWDKTRFIQPSCRRHEKYRLYTFNDLILLKLAKTIRDHGFSIQRLRATIAALKSLLPKITEQPTTILVEGDRIFVCSGEVCINEADDIIRFDVATFRQEIDNLWPELSEKKIAATAAGATAAATRSS